MLIALLCIATDEAGNESSQTVTVDVTDFDEINPAITGPSGEAGDATSAASIVENTTAVYGFTADETVTWSLGESADKDKFAIDETGALSFVEAPDYETPGSAEESNAYSVVVVATDEVGNESSQTVTVDVTDFDEIPPIIARSDGDKVPFEEIEDTGVLTKSIKEERRRVGQLTANEEVTWSVEGDDAEKFVIDDDGVLKFRKNPDYETPSSDAGTNDYSVIVKATDLAKNESTKEINVSILNDTHRGEITKQKLTVGVKNLK